MVDQAEEGDAHTIREEYRGYILDGGGLNGFGGGAHPGGHIRLDPAQKEILVEVDRAAVLNNVPGAGNDTNAKLKTILNGASGVFSNLTRGAGIYMYWLMDQDALQINAADVDTFQKQFDKLADTRNVILKSDFHHILMYDVGNIALFASSAAAYGAIMVSETPGASHHGVVFTTSETDTRYPVGIFPKREEVFSTVIAHEITHLLIPDGTLGAFARGEHIKAPNADESELMYETTSPANRELSTVKIFDVVQAVLKTKLSEGLDQ